MASLANMEKQLLRKKVMEKQFLYTADFNKFQILQNKDITFE